MMSARIGTMQIYTVEIVGLIKYAMTIAPTSIPGALNTILRHITTNC